MNINCFADFSGSRIVQIRWPHNSFVVDCLVCFLELTAYNTDIGRASFKQFKTLNDIFKFLSPCVRFDVYTLECVRYSVSGKESSLPGILQGLNFVNTSQKTMF